jgi:MYXO-CTERM domain-containing protein
MNARALRRTIPTVALLLVMCTTVMALPMVLAQAPGTPPGGTLETGRTDARTSTTDDGMGNWGLLGLLGLVGLAGLMRRDRPRLGERPAERVGRP